MQLVQFSLDTLKDLDGGKASAAFEQHVRRAALDCLDRPGDPAARKVTFEVSLSPRMDPTGDCTEVEVQIRASSVVPKHQTKPYSFGLRRGGMLVFNPDSTDNVNQSTLIDGEDQ
jgi:hypothetical protein